MKIPQVVPFPKPIKLPKVSTPKIASVHITPVNQGFKLQHNMDSGPKPQPFVFQNPALALRHLSKVEGSQWREPDRSEGSAIPKELNINTSAE